MRSAESIFAEGLRNITAGANATQISSSQDSVLLTNLKTASLPLDSISSDRFGIKAAASAPSPSNRRNRLGSVKAAVKAELSRLVPKIAVIITSRNSPNTRDSIVIADTKPICPSILDMT